MTITRIEELLDYLTNYGEADENEFDSVRASLVAALRELFYIKTGETE